jgi:hypothetical protein
MPDYMKEKVVLMRKETLNSQVKLSNGSESDRSPLQPSHYSYSSR